MSPQPTQAQELGNPSQSADGTKEASTDDPVLCDHCRRTASNGIRCLGMCVADSQY
ncbi:hypothetical protein [Parasynechococcus sp.]|uniref:hypothetical protein n=1 Tax=Parasynechococcus sp. TaxID=3101203 RepID=UPI0037040C10